MKRLAFVILGLMVLSCSPSWAQGRCVPFTGTINAGLTPGGWVGTATFNIEEAVAATTLTVNTGLKKGDPLDPENKLLMGTEVTTVLFPGGGGFRLITKFVGVHTLDTPGWVNETGTIEPLPDATGKYENVSGHFTSHGPFGFGIPAPETVPSPIGWYGEYHGNICGIE